MFPFSKIMTRSATQVKGSGLDWWNCNAWVGLGNHRCDSEQKEVWFISVMFEGMVWSAWGLGISFYNLLLM